MVDYICAQGHTTQLNYARREAPAFLYTFCRQCGEPTRLDLAVKMNRYLRFEMVEKKPKTEVYVISSLKKYDTEVLARISWYGKWRRYVFYLSEGTLFDAACLGEVKEFIDNLMKERKQANREKEVRK